MHCVLQRAFGWLQRSLESFEAERSNLENDNAALRKALHSLEVSLFAAARQQATRDNASRGSSTKVVQFSGSPLHQ